MFLYILVLSKCAFYQQGSRRLETQFMKFVRAGKQSCHKKCVISLSNVHWPTICLSINIKHVKNLCFEIAAWITTTYLCCKGFCRLGIVSCEPANLTVDFLPWNKKEFGSFVSTITQKILVGSKESAACTVVQDKIKTVFFRFYQYNRCYSHNHFNSKVAFFDQTLSWLICFCGINQYIIWIPMDYGIWIWNQQ